MAVILLIPPLSVPTQICFPSTVMQLIKLLFSSLLPVLDTWSLMRSKLSFMGLYILIPFRLATSSCLSLVMARQVRKFCERECGLPGTCTYCFTIFSFLLYRYKPLSEAIHTSFSLAIKSVKYISGAKLRQSAISVSFSSFCTVMPILYNRPLIPIHTFPSFSTSLKVMSYR